MMIYKYIIPSVSGYQSFVITSVVSAKANPSVPFRFDQKAYSVPSRWTLYAPTIYINFASTESLCIYSID
jgi:hypothetical protein